jgi:uncharacterized protein (UPF0210 family)
MSYRIRAIAALTLLLAVAAIFPAATSCADDKPKIRAITAFVRLDIPKAAAQIQDALVFLRKAKADFEKAGYEVQTIRITPQPFAVVVRNTSRDAVHKFYADLAALSKKEGFALAIGPAMLHDDDDPRTADLLAEVLAANPGVNGSVTVADEDGPHPNGIRAAARIMKYLEDHTPRGQGNFNFAAAALVPAYTPFFPASFHIDGGQRFAIAWQGASVVDDAFSAAKGDPTAASKALAARVSVQAFAIEKIAAAIALDTRWAYMGLDLSTAPLKDVSIGAAIEKLTGAPFGSSGTLSAAAIITAALKEAPVQQVGYSGLMMPILEDARLAQRWSEGHLTVDQMLAYSSVCGTGLDTIPLPGDVTEQQLARIISDMATLAVKLKKPLTARLFPVPGKKAGDSTEFDDPFLVNAVIHPLP